MENIGLYFLALIIPLVAQLYITSTYNKYKKIENKNKLTGFDVARKILDKNGLKDIYIVEVNGNLTDHYDPRRKTVRLSSDVFHGDSVSSMAIAAHECGHAIQDKEGYLFMKIRSLIAPIVSIGTKFAYVVLIIGLIANMLNIIYAGIALVGLGLLFQLITLPVEIDASKRAVNELSKMVSSSEEENHAKSVLIAAALTYVAGVLSSMLEILRLILIFTNNRD